MYVLYPRLLKPRAGRSRVWPRYAILNTSSILTCLGGDINRAVWHPLPPQAAVALFQRWVQGRQLTRQTGKARRASRRLPPVASRPDWGASRAAELVRGCLLLVAVGILGKHKQTDDDAIGWLWQRLYSDDAIGGYGSGSPPTYKMLYQDGLGRGCGQSSDLSMLCLLLRRFTRVGFEFAVA